MNEKEFENFVYSFLYKIRCENTIDESIYDKISDYLLSNYKNWLVNNSVPTTIFKACITLTNFLAGGNCFLHKEDQERLEDMSDELYGILLDLH